jgi:NAD(P)H dehydrogenase (quinone)
MCFPSKKQRANFDDSSPADKSKNQQQPATNGAAASTTPAPAPAPTSTAAETNNVKAAMAPKVAIVIYSMYGHIAASKYLHLIVPLYDPH